MKQRNLSGKKLEEYKKTLELTDEQREIIVGTLLGDSSFGGLREGKVAYCLEFSQGRKSKRCHAGYLMHLYEVFEPFVGSPPRVRVVATNQTKDNETLVFRTYRHDSLKFYHGLFHKMIGSKMVKVVPDNIHKFLTPRALAYWFMDDGTSTKGNYQFCTDCFSYDEQVILKEALLKNFSVETKIFRHKKIYRIEVLSGSKATFEAIIKPYVDNIDCMKSKIV